MKTTTLIIGLFICTLFVGCESKTVNIDVINDDGKAVMGLDYRDFDQAASNMIQSLLGSGSLRKAGGGKYVMVTSSIVNDTMQRIDTSQLMAKIEQDLMNSSQVVITSALGGSAGDKDEMIYEMRDIRDSELGEEFEDENIPTKKQLIAPELSISGKIIQRDVKYGKNQKQVEYYFQLKVTNLNNGLRFWQNEAIIGKRGSSKSVSW